ncbi:ABC transporter ATP-binding protein [Mycobacterium sp. NPDC003449]
MGESRGLTVRGLRVAAGEHRLVDGVDLELAAGTITTLVGPSGAGKSTIAAALAGTQPASHRVTGVIDRPRRVGYLPQDAAATLNPARRIGTALAELAVLHGNPPSGRARRRLWKRRRVTDLLRQAAFETDPTHHRRYPFQFSGGQRVRLALAAVLATDPELLVLDEPTSGLDPVSRDELIGVLDRLRRTGRTVLLVTHDHAVATGLSDRVIGVRDGRLTPELAPAPDPSADPATGPGELVLEVSGIRVRRDRTDLVRAATFGARTGELIAIVGPSGAGKTTLARAVGGLEPLSAGTVLVDGVALPALRSRNRRQLAAVQYVWQETRETFDRTRPILDQVALTALRLRGLGIEDARAEAVAELGALGVTAAQASRRPGDLSGGQLRRAALARALLARPTVLLCDEPTTGLDPAATELVLARLGEYRNTSRAAILVCSHDLPALLPRADRILTVDDGTVTPETDGYRVGTGIAAVSSSPGSVTLGARFLK